jgi:CRP/FNR family transcriptional regulator, cyclic AMP receptor protein
MNGAVRILSEDPELAAELGGHRLDDAVDECVAQTCDCRAGPWTPLEEIGDMRFGIGLLILDGLVIRSVGMGGRYGAELLGDGDLLNPYHREDRETSLPVTGRWRVVRSSRFAILDSDFVMRATRYPEVVSALMLRALKRSRHLAVNMAIVQQPRVDVRLHMLFWTLADRWGTVHQDGVHVRVALTHAMLSELVAARRPTITKALGELAQRSAVIWTGTDWVLPGDPPAELDELGALMIPVGA